MKGNIGTYTDGKGNRIVVGDYVLPNPKYKKLHGLKLKTKWIILSLANEDVEMQGVSKSVKGKITNLGAYNIIRSIK